MLLIIVHGIRPGDGPFIRPGIVHGALGIGIPTTHIGIITINGMDGGTGEHLTTIFTLIGTDHTALIVDILRFMEETDLTGCMKERITIHVRNHDQQVVRSMQIII